MSKYNIEDIVKTFNKTVKQLINIISQHIDNNILYDSFRNKINILIQTDPLFVLCEGGTYLFKYRDSIHNDDFDTLFLNTENILKEEDKNLIEDKKKNLSLNNKNDIELLITFLREIWTTYSIQEKKIIQKKIKLLLSEYSKYLFIKSN